MCVYNPVAFGKGGKGIKKANIIPVTFSIMFDQTGIDVISVNITWELCRAIM